MHLSRLPGTHVRFEPEVDGGSTYAFSFCRSDLVIGRERMYRLLQAVGPSPTSLEALSETWVQPSADPRGAYPDQLAFLTDVMRLVAAGVLAAREEAGARP